VNLIALVIIIIGGAALLYDPLTTKIPDDIQPDDGFDDVMFHFIQRRKTMMSKDRVRFTLGRNGHGVEAGALNAARRAFKLSPEAYERAKYGEVTIICRPSQFAQFLIWRNENGAKNGFQELNAKLLPMQSESKVFDVSGAEA